MTLELLPYQHKGAAFLAGRSRAGLFDSMGVGKTAQAIAALDLIWAKKILIVCPAAVRETWRGEFKKFSDKPRKIMKGSEVHHLNLWLRDKIDVLIVSYELATKWTPYIMAAGDLIDVIVFDESHYLKSPSANRTTTLLGKGCDGKSGLVRWAAHVWYLSGTPIPNDPIDIWSFLRSTGATLLSQDHFKKRYFTSRMGAYSARQEPIDKQMPELRQAIRAVSMRRTKEDAGLNLPPIWLTTQTVDGDTADIKALLQQHPRMETAVLEAIEKGGLSFLDAQHIATLRRLVGEAKAPAFLNLLKEELDNGLTKVVVMGIHTHALATIKSGLSEYGVDCVSVDGSVREADRVRAVERFQRDDDCRVFVGNIRAAGTGLTLTAAADIIMFESDWSPAGNAQAIMRIHRKGQEKACRARFISLANSIDEVVAEVVARKTAAIAKTGFGMQTA